MSSNEIHAEAVAGGSAGSAVGSGGSGTPITHITVQGNPNAKPVDHSAEINAVMQAVGAYFQQKVDAAAAGKAANAANSDSNEIASGTSDYYEPGASASSYRPISGGELSGGYPISPVFKQYFDKCTNKLGLGACKFVNLGIMGDAAHRARASCHNTGEAIDVGVLTCANGGNIAPYPPNSNAPDQRYAELGNCMATQSDDKLKVLFNWGDPPNVPIVRPNMQLTDTEWLKKAHLTHMHIQLKTCTPRKG